MLVKIELDTKNGDDLNVLAAISKMIKFASIASEPAKPEPTKPEPTKPEPAKPEQAKPEQAKPEQAKPEQAKPEQAKPEPAKPEPTDGIPIGKMSYDELSLYVRTIDNVEIQHARLLGKASKMACGSIAPVQEALTALGLTRFEPTIDPRAFCSALIAAHARFTNAN